MGKEFVEGWNIVQILGEGAYGEVQLVMNVSTKEFVAVKKLDSNKDSSASSNIQKEVYIHRRLNHENIVRFYGHRQEDPIHYIFLEYASGGELFDRIEPDVGMPHSMAQKYFLQILNGVVSLWNGKSICWGSREEYLHSNGITHRDLKPENILLDANDVVKISDFGLATIFRHKGTERVLKNRCGTLPYIAPEVFTQAYKAEPADIWSCGILLVAMLSGELPWDEATHECQEFRSWIKSNFSISPWKKIDNLPLALIKKILLYSPSKRYGIKDIQNNLWCKKVLVHEDTVRWTGDSRSRKRLCSDLDQPSVLREESITKMSFSQPAPVTRELGKSHCLPGDINGFTVGVSFSQPVDPDNMILSTQFSTTQSVSKTSLPIGTRMTRFCIALDIETVYSELIRALDKLGYCWKHSTSGQVTVTTQDRRKMQLIFKANLIIMSENILVDFRRSRGDGIEFKRHFLRIKESLSHIIQKQLLNVNCF